MVFDAIEAAYTVVLANFSPYLAALAAAKGVVCDTTANVVKRQSAELYMALGLPLPGIGIWADRVATQAKNQGARDNETTLVLDYYCEGTGDSSVAVTIAKQAELAAESLLLSVDKMTPGTGGVFGNAELLGSVRIEFTDAFTEGKAGADGKPVRTYKRRVQLTFPVYDRDAV